MQYMNNKWVNNVYISLSKTKDIMEELKLNYSIIDKNQNDYASTLDNASKPANIKIYDFLKNDEYNIYTIENLLTSNRFLYADYLVYYRNISDFNNFISESNQLMKNIRVTENDMMDFHEKTILMIGIAIFFIAFIIYIIIEIFSTYKQAKKISIMQMLGISDSKVCWHIIKQEIVFYALIPIFLLSLSYILLPNITPSIILQMSLLSLIIMILFCLLTFISVLIISLSNNVVNILKNQQIVSRLLKIGIVGKFILNILFIIIVMITISMAGTFQNESQYINNSKEYANYAYFTHINQSNEQYNPDNHSDLNSLYVLMDQSGLEYQYIESAQYEIYEKQDIQLTNQAMKAGEYFPVISVNINYLDKIGLNIVDVNGNKAEFKEASYEKFIFPKGYESYHESFVKFYEKEQADYPTIRSDFTFYSYESMKFPVFSPNSNGDMFVTSKLLFKEPIIRVIYKDYPVNYIDDMYGLSVAGVSSYTGLKIKTDINKDNTYKKLLPILRQANIEKILTIDSFVTIGELEGNKFMTTQLVFYIESAILILIFAIYTIITFEMNCLYIEKEKRKLLIKNFLGFNFWDMFPSIFRYNFFILIAIILISIVIHIFISPIINVTFIFIMLVIFMFEQFILWLATRQISLDNITQLLKGE